MAGVKETVEALEAARIIISLVKKVLADGKLTTGDIGVLFDVMRAMKQLNDGIQGADQVVAELKDLTAEESEVVIAKAMEIVALFNLK